MARVTVEQALQIALQHHQAGRLAQAEVLYRQILAQHPELAADRPEDYVKIAVDLANDLARLSHVRSTLRRRMEQSPLMDGPRFARNLEAAYRQMWRQWCAC
jgi:predicted O-linked N-acetylglucosamine transferase (SPINDLY family)